MIRRALLNNLSRAGMSVNSEADTATRIKALNGFEVFVGEDVIGPNISKLEYSEVLRGYGALWQLPDEVRNHPVAAQKIYMVTFNNFLSKTGDRALAFEGARRAMRTKLDSMREEKRKLLNRGGVDTALIRWGIDRAIKGPKVQIVVP